MRYEWVDVPSLRDDNVVERFVGFAKAGEADFEDHCLSTLLLERKSLGCQWTIFW